MKIVRTCDKIIEYCFAVLFFLTPLILTPWNYELFEFNKMMLVYAITIIIAGLWLIKMVLQRRILFQRTPFDLPLLLFLLSQIVSTFVSIDRHVSLFGYYSRFNGGLFSIICYLLLYYALVSNITKNQILKFLKLSLLSGLIVSLYGILEHFGIDKNLWVQDVQNRVFSTLGQPNWLGAYLAILIPIAMGFIFFSKTVDDRKWKIGVENRKSKIEKDNLFSNFNSQPLSSIFHHLSSISFYFSLSAFYLCLLYAKSRSGLIGFGLAYIIFWLGLFWTMNLTKQSTIVGRFVNLASQGETLQNFFRPTILLFTFYFLLSVLVGTPWTPSLSELFHRPLNSKYQILNTSNGPALETGGTESGEIRKIVWSGAIDIARHYPLFGSGVETFAFSYYKFRPAAHNLVSEWDFLYNKAHNEYLNYAATTGFVGLGAYIFLIGSFLFWSFKKMWEVRNEKLETEMRNGKTGISLQEISFQYPASHLPLLISLLAAYISILVTNFFGFSVVVISVYFWLIPAFCVIILRSLASQPPELNSLTLREKLSLWQKIAVVFVLFSVLCSLFSVLRMWYADVRFNVGYQLSRAGSYQQAYQPFHEAIDANPGEPFYRDELSFTNAMLSVAALQLKESTLSAQLAREAILENQKALAISPLNVNFYKTRTKVYYTLASLGPNAGVFDQKALESLQKAKTLAPNDPKITYNIALLLGRLGKNQEAVKTLEEAIILKPNYQDARFALALFDHEAGKKEQAIKQLEYILKNISPTDKQIQEKLKEWRN